MIGTHENIVEADVRDAVGSPITSLPLFAAAGLSVAANLLYLWMAPGAFGYWWAYAVFLFAAGMAQGLYGVALMRHPAQPVLLLGITGNLLLAAFYLATRTIGMPLGPGAWVGLAVGTPDVLAVAVQLGVVLALVPLLGPSLRGRAVNALLVLGGLLWAIWLFGLLPF